MRLQRLAKDPNSGYGGSQTVYDVLDEPEFCVVQGLRGVPDGSLDNAPPHENATKIKRSILVDAVRAMGYTVT